jgi:hypothetical protein
VTCKKLGTSGFLCSNIQDGFYGKREKALKAFRGQTRAERIAELEAEVSALRLELAIAKREVPA